MPVEPTALEKQAAGLEMDALARTDEAIGHLRAAERALLEEERQHSPHVGIRNQYRLVAYAEIILMLDDARHGIIARLTGTPRAGA